MSPLLTVATENGVALLTLDDPGRRNILSGELSDALIAAIEEIGRRDDVRAVVLTGRGSVFCAGADLGDLLAAGDGDEAGVQKVYEAFGGVADLPLPTIAAVNGPAVGAGMNLALACDVRIASPAARFDCRFLAIGIHPGGGHAWMLARLVGPQTAAAMLLLGETVRAEDAVRTGLAWSIHDDADLVPAALRLASRARGAPAALLRDIKATLRSTPGLDDRSAALAIETERQLDSLRRPEAAERISWLRAKISS